MDVDPNDPEMTVTPPVGGGNTLNIDNERLDCEHLEDMTLKYSEQDRPSFITMIFRFFGNIVVDCFRAIFN